MKAVGNREGLLTAFQVASSVVPARSPKPILRNVKLEMLESGDAILMATDLELGIRYRVSGVTIEQPGEVILPTAEFTAILRELPDEQVVLEETGSGVRVAGAASKFELPAEDPLQFPEFPGFGEQPGQKIKAGVFATMIKRTVFAVAQENSRYALHSVLIEFDDQAMAKLVATDGKRLALMPGQATLAGEKPDGTYLLSPKTLSLLAKTLLDPEEELEITLRENEALLRTAKMTVYSRLVDGRFPRYQEVFPPQPKIKIPLEVGKFMAALRQARIVTSEESKGVDFHFTEGLLTLESQAAELGQSEVRLPVAYTGSPLKITFDPQLLIDALRVLEPEEELSLELIDTRKAAVLRTRDQYAYVVMPLTRERERA